ncbi:septum site-determining protein MinD [Kyrpidia tusciae]|uniref:Septum site-determining protein MinD n=1 Tax=Kyrpidia tusciae (strain DSM 2912 / NBRC 15312 / T2) TaxID=562970 RepID=D5WUP7_KYRT2|nr:septum site-determining protein MinD [Kyrpidia tusciae]ADG05437.1 septum site-determining protein MinD [Kyrpidia tusciae DSM 2912]
MGDAVVVTSGKGGVGKTTSTANIGVALALLGKRVCLVDADIGLRNLDVVLGLENRILFDVVDVAQGECRLEQALAQDKRVDRLVLLPASQTKDKTALTPEAMRKIVRELKDQFDYVLIDCPAGIEQGFRVAVAGADRAVILATPEHAAVRDADRVIGLLQGEGIQDNKLIINRVRPAMVRQGDMLEIEEVVSILAIDLLGVVPDDETVIRGGNQGEPAVLVQGSKAGQAYRNIARRILGEPVPLMALEENGNSWLGWLRRVIGLRR